MIDNPTQLSLFDVDRLRTGEGFEALADLDLERAQSVFEEVLGRYPEAADAADGLRIAHHWRGVLARCEHGDDVAAADLVWTALKEAAAASPPLVTRGLRRAVAARVLGLLERCQDAAERLEQTAPRLLIELGRAREAEEMLRPAVAADPTDAGLLRLHGDALWAQGRRVHARQAYARALIHQPGSFPVDGLPDEALAHVIHRFGAEMAPVFGWIERILPLPQLTDELPNTRPARLSRLLTSAESSRRSNDHEEMVGSRQALREEAPEVFDAYMDRLQTNL